jgi:hypothetical protein
VGDLPELIGADLSHVLYPSEFAVAESISGGVRVLCLTDGQAAAMELRGGASSTRSEGRGLQDSSLATRERGQLAPPVCLSTWQTGALDVTLRRLRADPDALRQRLRSRLGSFARIERDRRGHDSGQLIAYGRLLTTTGLRFDQPVPGGPQASRWVNASEPREPLI